MLALLINKFKKILTILIFAALITASITTVFDIKDEFISYTVGAQELQQRTADVIVRVGEYKGKPGKRIYVNGATLNIPDDIPIRNDNDGKGFYVSEWDINVKEAKALVKKLQSQGINARIQVAYSKSEDLNAAGKIANKSNPYIYVSVHHNYYESNSRGYFAMYNQGNVKAQELARKLSESIKYNGAVPQGCNRANDGYIGELNSLNNNITGVLLELGFFSNLDELEIICSNEYVDYVTTQLANEIANEIILQYN